MRLGYVLPQKMVKAKVRTLPEGLEIFCPEVGAREELKKIHENLTLKMGDNSLLYIYMYIYLPAVKTKL